MFKQVCGKVGLYICVCVLLLLSFQTWQLKQVKIGPTRRRIRVEGRTCHDWMAMDIGKEGKLKKERILKAAEAVKSTTWLLC